LPIISSLLRRNQCCGEFVARPTLLWQTGRLHFTAFPITASGWKSLWTQERRERMATAVAEKEKIHSTELKDLDALKELCLLLIQWGRQAEEEHHCLVVEVFVKKD